MPTHVPATVGQHNAYWAYETFVWLKHLISDSNSGSEVGRYATIEKVAIELCNYALEQDITDTQRAEIKLTRKILKREIKRAKQTTSAWEPALA